MIDVFKNQSKAIKGTALASEDTVNSANCKALGNETAKAGQWLMALEVEDRESELRIQEALSRKQLTKGQRVA